MHSGVRSFHKPKSLILLWQRFRVFAILVIPWVYKAQIHLLRRLLDLCSIALIYKSVQQSQSGIRDEVLHILC
jgi:hypothetical protein